MTFANKLYKPLKSIINTLPVMLGIILLLGLLKSFITFDRISMIFTQNLFLDTGIGALIGSLFAGNSMNSYIIASELGDAGISLYAITAFLVSWVTVGLLQVPIEAEIFGKSFAIKRNLYSALLSMAVAFITVLLWEVL